MKQAVLIVDDVKDMLKFLSRLIKKNLPVELYTASDADSALQILDREEIGVVLTDIRMPRLDGLQFLKKIKQLNGAVSVIMMTAYGSIESAVESLKLGAYDYVTKPFDETRLVHTIGKALEHWALARRNLDLEKQIKDRETMEALVGQSRPIRNLIETVRRVAATEATLLITGETGTGKDLTAKMVHALSRRAGKAFVAVNCPAIPENILESELFGYRRGAFTGAGEDKEGLFETADGGTIFLDEIGDISPILQAKLLRVLQEKEIKPLGDTRTRKVDVRIIASTNRDLAKKIAQGEFRDDLYYRLNVVSIRTPALREIPEDIPRLANHFLALACAELGVAPKRFAEEVLRKLVARRWSGNVRELQNKVKRAAIFARGELIGAGDFEEESTPLVCPEEDHLVMLDAEYKEAKRRVVECFDTQYIRHQLTESAGNVSVAARRAGLERQSLQYLMKKYGIEAGSFRDTAK